MTDTQTAAQTGTKWVNVDAGPRQIKDLNEAIRELTREGQTHDELTGVAGGKEHATTYWSPFGGSRPETAVLDTAIREQYGYQVTRKNVRAIIAAYQAAVPELAKSRPVQDSRRSAEEDAELTAKIAARDAEDAAKRDAEQSLLDQVLAKAPAGAQALIVAEYHVDKSDLQTDYAANSTTRCVAIGWRFSKREDFRALHAAAAAFPETAGVTFEERRDNYSMGKGNYLTDHGWDGMGTGWVVKSRTIPCRYVHLTEDAIPAAAQSAGTPTAPVDGVTVSEGQAGNTEVRFPDKPAFEVRKGLKDHGFRWNGRDKCWYGKDAAYANSLAG